MSPSPRELLTLALRQNLPSFIHRCFQTVVPGQRYAKVAQKHKV